MILLFFRKNHNFYFFIFYCIQAIKINVESVIDHNYMISVIEQEYIMSRDYSFIQACIAKQRDFLQSRESNYDVAL